MRVPKARTAEKKLPIDIGEFGRTLYVGLMGIVDGYSCSEPCKHLRRYVRHFKDSFSLSSRFALV